MAGQAFPFLTRSHYFLQLSGSHAGSTFASPIQNRECLILYFKRMSQSPQTLPIQYYIPVLSTGEKF